MQSNIDKTNRLQVLIENINTKPDTLNPRQIAALIMRIPPEKWKAAQDVVDAIVTKKNAEKNLKAVRATKMLFASNNKTQQGLTNAEDRKAFVDDSAEVQELEADLITKDAEMTSAKLYHEVIDDLFTAAKKVMEYLISQEKAQRDFDKYNNEAIRNV